MRDLRVALITGIDKKSKIRVVESAQKTVSTLFPGHELFAYDIYQEMRELARKDGHVAERANITNMAPDQLKGYRTRAYMRVLDKFDAAIRDKSDRSKCVALVLTRTIAPAKGDFYVTLDESHMQGIAPDCCFTVTDDVQTIASNLKQDEAWGPLGLDELGVLDKRQQEIKNAEQWCTNNLGEGTRHFLLAVSEPPETLLGTLFPGLEHPNRRKRFYLSFPITEADPKLEAARLKFRDKLRQSFVIFDPGTIREYDKALREYQAQSAAPRGRKKPKSDRSQQQKLKQLLGEFGKVTVRNDLRLVSQSDGVIVYYPSRAVRVQDSTGRWREDPSEIKVLSAGVISEMIHASTRGKKVYVLWLSEKVPSPFLSFYADEPIFLSETEFFRSDLFP